MLGDQIGIRLSEVWDGVSVKLTFRRTFSESMMQRWYELEDVVKSVSFSDEGDAWVWQYESKGVYSTQSLYVFINFKGVQPVYIPALWKVIVPPRIQILLWLMSNNKLLTVDNLAKRGIVKPEECQFCCEKETIHHIFFDCVVAKKIWSYVENFSNVNVCCYLDMASKWACGKNFRTFSSISAGVCWAYG
jgi:hypothetical protein